MGNGGGKALDGVIVLPPKLVFGIVWIEGFRITEHGKQPFLSTLAWIFNNCLDNLFGSKFLQIAYNVCKFKPFFGSYQ